MRPSLQDGVFNWGWATQVWQQRRMDIEAAILREIEDARWHEEAEGDGYDEVYRGGGGPAGEGVEGVGGEVEVSGCDLFYWDYR